MAYSGTQISFVISESFTFIIKIFYFSHGSMEFWNRKVPNSPNLKIRKLRAQWSKDFPKCVHLLVAELIGKSEASGVLPDHLPHSPSPTSLENTWFEFKKKNLFSIRSGVARGVFCPQSFCMFGSSCSLGN